MMNIRRFLIIVFLAFVGIASSFADKKKKNTPEYEAQLAATMVAIDSIMSGHDLNEPIEGFCDKVIKRFDKEPRLEVHIAEQFLRSKLASEDIAYARMEKLIKKYPKFMDGYLTYAQLLVERSVRMQHNDSLASVSRARQVVDSCKTVLPDSIEPYMKWVRMFLKRDYKEVDNEAEALRRRFPDYPVYSKVATMYGNLDDNIYLYRSLEYLQKEDKNLMAPNVLIFYSNLYGLLRKYEEGIDIANFALEKSPNSPLLLRNLLKFNTEMGNKEKRENSNKINDMAKLYYTDAIAASEKLFANGDTIQHSYEDYYYSGLAYQEMKQSKKAYGMFRKQLQAKDFDYIKKVEYWEAAIDSICSYYKSMGYMDSTLLEYKNYLMKRQELGLTLKDHHYYFLAQHYDGYSEELMGDEKIDAYHNADSLYLKASESSTRSNLKLPSLFYHIECQKKIERIRMGKQVWGEGIRDELLKMIEYANTLEQDKLSRSNKTIIAYTYLWLMQVYIESDVVKVDYDKAFFYAEEGLKLKTSVSRNILIALQTGFATQSVGRYTKKAQALIDTYNTH